MSDAKRDGNHVPTLIAASNVDGITPVVLYADPTTHRLLTTTASAAGTVTSVSVTTANGVSGSVATATTTPAITLTLGAITPTTVNALTLASQAIGFTIAGGTTPKTLTVPLDATVSGTNTGDQTNISGNAATVTVADAGGDSTTFPLLGTDLTGSLSPRTDAGLTYDATANTLTTTTFAGALSGNATTATSATSATTATHLAGGLGGQIPYQSAAGTTAMLANGTAGQVLSSQGTTVAPQWIDAGVGTVTSVSVATANGFSGTVATSTTTPAITIIAGAIVPTTVNGLTITTSTGTLTITNAKTLAVTNTLTLSGTDSTVMTFPTTSATIARTDAANTFTGVQTMTSASLTTPTLNGVTALADAATISMIVPTADGTATGPVTSSFVSAYTSSAIGDLVYLNSSSKWALCDANTLALYNGLLGIALTVAATDATLKVALPGSMIYATGFPAMTIGSPLYMSETAGAITHTAPVTTDSAMRVIGWAVHADKVFFFPSPDYTTHV